jgi:hypothetical protein
MKIQLDDIMKVEDELSIQLTDEQRIEVLNQYYQLDSDNKIYQPWSDVVENLILELIN